MPKYDAVSEEPQLPPAAPAAPPVDTDPFRSFTSELPISVARALRATAAMRGVTVKALLTDAVTQFLEREGVPLPSRPTS